MLKFSHDHAEALFCWWLSIPSRGSGMPTISQWSEIGLFLQETAAGAGPAQPQSSSDIKLLM